jgi:cation transport ATPase
MLKLRHITKIILKEFTIPFVTLITIVLFLIFEKTMMFQLARLTAIVGIVLGSFEMFKETILALRKKQFALDYIAILAILVALFTGEYLAGLVVAFMLATGNTLETYGMNRARRSLTQLVNRIPHDVSLYENGHITTTVPIEHITIGQTIFIRKGEVIALDGVLESDTALTDESSLTGEPYFLEKNHGDQIRSGTINIGEPIVIQVTNLAGDSTYEKIIQMVKSAAEEKPPLVRLADRYSTIFTIITFVIAGIAYGISHDIVRVLAVLVVATPCPLILATPIALLGGMNAMAKYNIIVKKIASIEILGRLSTIIFDKTGTITLGRPTVTQVETLSPLLPLRDLVAIAAAIERNSLHPLAKAIVAYAQHQAVPLLHAKNVHEEIGKGHIGKIAFKCLMHDKRFEITPMSLETPKSTDCHEDKEALDLLRSL